MENDKQFPDLYNLKEAIKILLEAKSNLSNVFCELEDLDKFYSMLGEVQNFDIRSVSKRPKVIVVEVNKRFSFDSFKGLSVKTICASIQHTSLNDEKKTTYHQGYEQGDEAYFSFCYFLTACEQF